jgi:KDO2-lipid IV(A) lauroyltransferase
MLTALSWLPLALLAGLARVIYFFLYKVFRYRIHVVRENIRTSLPSLTDRERLEIERKYYRHLSELMPELIRFIKIRTGKVDLSENDGKSPKGAERYISLAQPGFLDPYLAEKKNLILMMGHFGNWEWSTLPFLTAGYRILGVYKPQSSRLADSLMKWIREKPGVMAVPMKDTYRVIRREIETGGDPFVLILISDQIPARGDIHYWTGFLNQETAFFTGGEKIAEKFGLTVLYADLEKSGFGCYRMRLAEMPPAAPGRGNSLITASFANNLEESIRRTPQLWLWSHRRWKYHKDDVPLGA